MDFKEYVDFSVHEDTDFAEEFANEIGGIYSDFGWVRLDAEVELIKYNKESKEAIIEVNWIAESRNTSSNYYGKAKVRVKIEGQGQKPAKVTFLELIEASDSDGLL